MSALDVLRQVKQARRAEGNHKVIEWGNADFISGVGIENLTRRELRNHLDARDLNISGNRLELLGRLRDSIADEQLSKFGYKETTDTEQLMEAELEERGSVYSVGTNSKGQLGVGDLEKRVHFTVISQLRGLGVHTIVTGDYVCFAVTEQHDVYMWGGGGAVKSFSACKSNQNAANMKQLRVRKSKTQNWLEPDLCIALGGEEIVAVAVGSSHYLAASRGGDCLVWGDNDSGQLGIGDYNDHDSISINSSFPSAIQQVEAGANHTVVLTKHGQLYSWGHSMNGRLGIGLAVKSGGPEIDSLHFCIPSLIEFLEPIRQVSCGSDHCLAYGASGVWSWGCGSGGKLGIGVGDNKDRSSPTLVPNLEGKTILQVAAGAYHSLAVVAYPPMIGGGWVYTWGSGYYGQLAQGSKVVSFVPELCEFFLSVHVLVKSVSTGARHCAVITKDDELYTWGSNTNNCLGRRIYERDVTFSAVPGHCGGFGAIVNRVGRGLVRKVSCGLDYTVVCTYPYVGPDLAVAVKLVEEANVRQQEALLRMRGIA